MSGSKPARDGARTAPSSGDTRRVHPDAVARAAVPSARPVMDPGTRQNPGAMTEPALLHQSCRRMAPRLQQIPALSDVLDGDAADKTQRSMCLFLFDDGFFIDIIAARDYIAKTSRPLLSRWSGEAAGCSGPTPHPAWLATLEAPMPQVDRQEVLTGAADRLRLAFAKAGGHRQTAAALGIPPRTLSHYVAGTEMPMSALVALSRACGVTLEWLARGAIRCVRAPPRRRSNRRFRSPCRYFFHGGHGAPRARHPRGGGPFRRRRPRPGRPRPRPSGRPHLRHRHRESVKLRESSPSSLSRVDRLRRAFRNS